VLVENINKHFARSPSPVAQDGILGPDRAPLNSFQGVDAAQIAYPILIARHDVWRWPRQVQLDLSN